MILKKKPKKVRVKCDFCCCEFVIKGSMWSNVDESYHYVTQEEINKWARIGVTLCKNIDKIEYKYISCPICAHSIHFEERLKWTK